MSEKEALARIKINKLLEEAGWRFFDTEKGKRNISLEHTTHIEDKDNPKFIDYLLLDESGYPICALEAKKDSIDPLFAKDQARAYAESQNIRFVILSNGDIHYLWDIKSGNPQLITSMPSPESLSSKKSFIPNPKALATAKIIPEYVALTQNPNLLNEPLYLDEKTKDKYCWDNGYRVLRPYQMQAIKEVQKAVGQGKNRFLLEMATGLGKTLTAGALIQLFLKTENAKRVLFLVDRIELENQAYKAFCSYLKDFTSVIYKKSRNDWYKANVVITTIQSIEGKHKQLFSPTDFDLLISDEAHRCIGGNSRAVFEYFVGYKLGLTATPKDYLKNIDTKKLNEQDPKALERRILLDTYKTFGCESGDPTFRYSLLDGVKAGYLVNPIVIDARTEITTQLLSDKGYIINTINEYGEEVEDSVYQKDFEKKFFSEETNWTFCKTFMENALKDPISGEIGKTIIFGVSQKHCAKLAQILNQIADKMYPGKYNSDFAVQITSSVFEAQQSTINFANNNLNGKTRFLEGYDSSKTRVCITVGMMTTGYDCSDLLNICLMRPIFSPTDFVQIKGRGTRKHTFKYTDADKQTSTAEKKNFKMFDFFGNCEYFEEKFNYDEELKLPKIKEQTTGEGTPRPPVGEIILGEIDPLKTVNTTHIGEEGMRIDREFFQKTKETLQNDQEIADAVDNEQWERAINIIKQKYENQPQLYMNLEKIKKTQKLDRNITWREVLEYVFNILPKFKSKDELLDDECDKFISIYKPNAEQVPYIKNFIKAYITDASFREIVDNSQIVKLDTNYVGFSVLDYRKIKGYENILPIYIKENVNMNLFM